MLSFADHALAVWLKYLKRLNLLGLDITRERKKNKKSSKMTDEITDKMSEGVENITNQGKNEVIEDCNDSFLSFLVYSFMKNMWGNFIGPLH